MIIVIPEKPVDLDDTQGLLKALGQSMASPQSIIIDAATLRLVVANSWAMAKELKTLREDCKLLQEKLSKHESIH